MISELYSIDGNPALVFSSKDVEKIDSECGFIRLTN